MGTTIFTSYVNNNTDYTVGSEVFGLAHAGIYGTPAANQVGIWKDSITMKGDSNLTWDSSAFTVTGDISVSGEVTADLTLSANILLDAPGTRSIGTTSAWLSGVYSRIHWWDLDPGSNNLASGLMVTAISTVPIARWDTVYYVSGGNLGKADADAIATMPVIGLAMNSTSGGPPSVNILTYGVVRYDSWGWTRGNKIYASGTAGGLTETPPVGSGDVVQVVGYAIDTNAVFVNPSFDWTEIP